MSNSFKFFIFYKTNFVLYPKKNSKVIDDFVDEDFEVYPFEPLMIDSRGAISCKI